MATKSINEVVDDWYAKFDSFPDGVHILCPKVDDEDPEDYTKLDDEHACITRPDKEKRIKDGLERRRTTLWNSILLALEAGRIKDKLESYCVRLEHAFTSCDKCIMNWHMGQSLFLREVQELYNETVVEKMREVLLKIDFDRLDKGIAWAKSLVQKVEENIGVFKTSAIGAEQSNFLITIFDALCCLPYISIAEKRRDLLFLFSRVCAKRPLRLGANVLMPAMTDFLFTSDRLFVRFAQVGWESMGPEAMTPEQFDWAVEGSLTEALKKISVRDTTSPESWPDIQQFWEGIPLILRSLSEDMVVHKLRAMEVAPSLYELLFSHLQCEAEGVVIATIKCLDQLITKAPSAFWDAIGDPRPFAVAEQVLQRDLFKSLLSQSMDPSMRYDAAPRPSGDESEGSPLPIAWIHAWIASVKKDQKNDACGSLLHLLFEAFIKDPTISSAGHAACVRAGFDSLTNVLKSFLRLANANGQFPVAVNSAITSPTNLLHVNTALNLVLQYKDVILDWAEKPGDPLDVQESALALIRTALELDARATAEECRALHLHIPVQLLVVRRSADLWDTFLDMLFPGNVRLADQLLQAMYPLLTVESFRPLRKAPQSLSPPRLLFNERFTKATEALGRVLRRLCAFSKGELVQLCNDQKQGQALRVVIGFTLHGEPEIQEAATELIKSLTGEASRSDAFLKLLQDWPAATLRAFNFATTQALKCPVAGGGTKLPSVETTPPYGLMPHILKATRDVLNGLCDPAYGLLRKGSMSMQEIEPVISWWIIQWHWVEAVFNATEAWSHSIEIKVMTDFCRGVIELAEALIAQDGLLASALKDEAMKSGRSTRSEPEIMSDMMTRVLQPCAERLYGFVRMIRLRDDYLVEFTCKILSKLFQRLREYNIEIDPKSRSFVERACRIGPDGKYEIGTKLTLQQKAELLRALDGDEGEDDDSDDVIDITSSRVSTSSPALPSKPRKQSTLEAWSKSGGSATAPSGSSKLATTIGSRSNRDDVLALSSSVDSRRSILDQIAARQKEKQKPPTDQKAILAKQAALRESRQRAKEEKAKRDAAAIAYAKAIRGDGAEVPKRSEIMVSSDDDDGDEDEDDGHSEELMELMRQTKEGQKALDDAERRRDRALLQKTRGPVKKQKIIRSSKDMRARLIPPMEALHAVILEWDIFHDGNDPPNGVRCLSVSSTYQQPRQYKETFLPLLTYEAWRSFVTAKDETTSKPFGIKIVSRMNVDSFLEVTSIMPLGDRKDRQVSEGDIILLSMDQDPINNKTAAHCLARISRIQIKKGVIEVTYRVGNKTNKSMAAALSPNSDIYAVKITNMTTIEREYAALESLQYYDLMDEVLHAKPSPILQYSDEAINSYMENYNLNAGQAKAVLGARDNDGFTLIQGPPGTGKTKTIVAMVGCLLTGLITSSARANAHAIGGPGNRSTAPAGPTKKLLVCAPSNAAVDELVLRLMGGVKSSNGSFHKIKVLRLGRSDAINAAVKEVTLDELVKKRLEGDNVKSDAVAERTKMHEDAARIRDELNELRPKLEEARAGENRAAYSALQREFDDLKRQQTRIGAKIDADKDSGNNVAREVELHRRRIQQEILDSAQVLCSTLSGSGHEMFRNLQNVEFETVIIDEAAQCVELSALIPLKYGASKCILVGDPKQLPPTVLSQSAARYGYDQSLFVRMQQNHPNDVYLLDRQYRMHPLISAFPSREFYDGLLVDGDDMARLRAKPWHASHLFGPYRFFDVKGVQSRGHKGQSLVNVEELNVALQLYERLRRDYSGVDLRSKVGIITPYKAQLQELRNRFTSRYGDNITETIEFNTTDAFQGRECEIIIFSCVRASPTGGIGFMTDIRRMNVGLTRAKSSLWILGDSRALQQGEFWNKLIQDAQSRNLYTSGDIKGLLSRPTERGPAWVAELPSNDVTMLDAPDIPAVAPSSSSAGPPPGVKVEATPIPRPITNPGPGPGVKPPAPASHRTIPIKTGQQAGAPPSNAGQGTKRSLETDDSNDQNSKRVCEKLTARQLPAGARHLPMYPYQPNTSHIETPHRSQSASTDVRASWEASEAEAIIPTELPGELIGAAETDAETADRSIRDGSPGSSSSDTASCSDNELSWDEANAEWAIIKQGMPLSFVSPPPNLPPIPRKKKPADPFIKRNNRPR